MATKDSSKQKDDRAKTIIPKPLTFEATNALLKPVFDREWLEHKSTEELIAANFEISRELRARMEKETRRIAIDTSPLTFKADIDTDTLAYRKLPEIAGRKKDAPPKFGWRVVLVSSEPKLKPLALDIYDDVIMGRAAEGSSKLRLDLDLTEYGAEESGVSRRHAILRPTKDSLLIFDLASTNGTQLNGNKLKAHTTQALRDGDTITLSKVHFRVRIVGQPKSAVNAESERKLSQ